MVINFKIILKYFFTFCIIIGIFYFLQLNCSELHNFYGANYKNYIYSQNIPKYDKYVSTETSCGGIGNQFYRFAIIYGVGRDIGRTPFFNTRTSCEMELLDEMQTVFPNWFNFIKIVSPDSADTFGTEMIENCSENERVKSIDKKYLIFKHHYPFPYKCFDKYKNELRYLFQFHQNFMEKVVDIGNELFSGDSSHKLCIHFRRGDFAKHRLLESQRDFILPVADFIFSKIQETHLTKVSIILFGTDDAFVKTLNFNTSMFASVYHPKLSSRDHDMALAHHFCDSFLISSSGSTFAWWIAYLLPPNVPVFYNHKVLKKGNYTELDYDEMYPGYWKRISVKNNNTARIEND